MADMLEDAVRILTSTYYYESFPKASYTSLHEHKPERVTSIGTGAMPLILFADGSSTCTHCQLATEKCLVPAPKI